MNRKPIFDAVRKLLGRSFTQGEVDALDKAFTVAEGGMAGSLAPEPVPPPPAAPAPAAAGSRTLGSAGVKLIQKWEGCEKRRADGTFQAYPDPGSRNGDPWTIGWGSTGADVTKGTIWTRAQCDERFTKDMQKYIDRVVKTLGTAKTSQNQFDALVSFHYNTGSISTATLTALHKAGKFADAQAQFGKWIYNDGKPMKGLKNRRADEAKLYGTP